MIIESFAFGENQERIEFNVFIEPIEIDGNTFYIVGQIDSGQLTPPPEKLQEVALIAETVCPFEHAVTLEEFCFYIENSIEAGTWASPFLISDQLLEINVPVSAFDEGVADAARGEHNNKNPYISGTKEADDWDEGWITGRDENIEGLRN